MKFLQAPGCGDGPSRFSTVALARVFEYVWAHQS